MDVTQVPQLRMVAGAPFSQVWQYLNDDDTPIDLSAWSATIAFKRGADPISTHPLQTDAQGNITLSLSDSAVGALSGAPITFQITLIPPIPELTEYWRGGVVVL